jgi:hypothetical protein
MSKLKFDHTQDNITNAIGIDVQEVLVKTAKVMADKGPGAVGRLSEVIEAYFDGLTKEELAINLGVLTRKAMKAERETERKATSSSFLDAMGGLKEAIESDDPLKALKGLRASLEASSPSGLGRISKEDVSPELRAVLDAKGEEIDMEELMKSSDMPKELKKELIALIVKAGGVDFVDDCDCDDCKARRAKEGTLKTVSTSTPNGEGGKA